MSKRKADDKNEHLELLGRITVDLKGVSAPSKSIIIDACRKLLLFEQRPKGTVSSSDVDLMSVRVNCVKSSGGRMVTLPEGYHALVWDKVYTVTGVWGGSKSIYMGDMDAFKSSMNDQKRLILTREEKEREDKKEATALLENYDVSWETKRAHTLLTDSPEIETVVKITLNIRITRKSPKGIRADVSAPELPGNKRRRKDEGNHSDEGEDTPKEDEDETGSSTIVGGFIRRALSAVVPF